MPVIRRIPLFYLLTGEKKRHKIITDWFAVQTKKKEFSDE